MTKFIGVISAKGGVGKTTTTINLTSAMHFYRRHVIALDANFANPDLGIHLGIHKVDKTLHSALNGKHSIRESVYKHPSGLMIIPGSLSYKDAMSTKRQNLTSVIYGLLDTTEAVIIDSTPGMGEDSRIVISACDAVIIVTTPDLIAVSDTLKMVKLADQLGRRIIGIIINKKRDVAYEMSERNIEEFLHQKVIGVIDDDDKIRHSLHRRQPLVLIEPESRPAEAYKKVASRLLGQKYQQTIEKQDRKSLFRQAMEGLGFKKFI